MVALSLGCPVTPHLGVHIRFLQEEGPHAIFCRELGGQREELGVVLALLPSPSVPPRPPAARGDICPRPAALVTCWSPTAAVSTHR